MSEPHIIIPKWEFYYPDPNKDDWGIWIKEGTYQGLIVRYEDARIEEQGEKAILHFSFDVIVPPDKTGLLLTDQNRELMGILGTILAHIALEVAKSTVKMTDDNKKTTTANSQQSSNQ